MSAWWALEGGDVPADRNRLSDADALIRRIEGDPVLRTPILVVALLDRSPDWVATQAAIEAASTEIPRMRQCLVSAGLGGGLRWVDDESFSLDHHLRRVRSATGGGIEAALDVAEPDAVADFDSARPLWRLTIVEGLDGGRAALVLRFHHTITDGVGGVQLAERLFSPASEAHSSATTSAAPPAERPTGASPGPLQAGASILGASVRAGLDPVGTIQTGVRAGRSIVRMLAPAREPLSPLLRTRGLDRRLYVLEASLDELHRSATVAGGTINDVLLAAVAGGLRRYHEVFDVSLDAVRVTMPINLRTEGDAAGGNHFTPARFTLPIDAPDPVDRIEIAGAIVRRWRHEPALGFTPLLASVLGLLPDPLVQRAFGGMLRSIDVNVVDVPGLRRPAYLAGARIDRLWAFAPATGAALSVTLVSHLSTACIAIASDRAAVADPDLMASCMDVALQEVLAVGRTAAAEDPVPAASDPT